jgi:hypothetical protein
MFEPGPRARWWGSILGSDVGRRWGLILLGVLLAVPTLSNRLVLDDLLLMRRLEPGRRSGWAGDMFTFASGAPGDARRAMDAGDLLPWWTSPELRVSFFRPLSAASHALDAMLWPRTAWLMQAHSLLLYALLLMVVSGLYGEVARTSRPTTALAGNGSAALFALAFFALDDSHGATLSWLANRSALLTTLLGAAALWSHHRLRAQGWRPGALLAPGLLAGALLAGEAAIATLGYLVAYAMFIEPPSAAGQGRYRRWLSLAPSLAVTLVWQIVYRVLHHGVSGSGVYADPLAAPAQFTRSLATNALALAGAELGLTSADLLAWGPPACVPLVLGAAVLGIASLIAMARPVLRARPTARFWAAGASLALLPISAGLPGDRLLLFVSVGAMGLLGELLDWYLPRWRAPRSSDCPPRVPLPAGERALRLVSIGLLCRRTVFALALLPIRTHAMQTFALGADSADAAIQRYGADADTVVFVNTPVAPDVSYLAARWALAHDPAPPRVRWLAESRDGVRVTRTGPHTLRIAPEGGFLGQATEKLYRDRRHRLEPGQTIRMAGMTASVVAVTDDGRPSVVDFTFTDDLQRHGQLWLTWKDGRYQPFPLPRSGESAIFAPARALTLSLALHPPEPPLSGRR